MRFDIKGNYDDNVLQEIYEVCQDKYGDKIEIRPAIVGLGFSIEMGALSSIASIVLAIISLCLQLKQDYELKKKNDTWDIHKLRKIIENELLKVGVVNYEIKSLKNFQSLISPFVVLPLVSKPS